MLQDVQGLSDEQINFWQFASNTAINNIPKGSPASFREIQEKFQKGPKVYVMVCYEQPKDYIGNLMVLVVQMNIYQK